MIRWFIFTYPKICIAFGASVSIAYVFTMFEASKQEIRHKISIDQALYLDDNKPKKSNNLIIYDGSKN